MTLQDQGVDAESIDLDLWSPTLDYIRGNITKRERDAQKRRSITIADAMEANYRFKNSTKEHGVIVGDAPGGISNQLRLITEAATHGIVLCRDDQTDQIRVWRNFFNDVGIAVIATVTSNMVGLEEVSSYDPIEVALANLDRHPKSTQTLRLLATLLRKRLGF